MLDSDVSHLDRQGCNHPQPKSHWKQAITFSRQGEWLGGRGSSHVIIRFKRMLSEDCMQSAWNVCTSQWRGLIREKCYFDAICNILGPDTEIAIATIKICNIGKSPKPLYMKSTVATLLYKYSQMQPPTFVIGGKARVN